MRFLMIPTDAVQVSSVASRRGVDPKNVSELAASIREFGQLQPIIVRKMGDGDQYELLAGEHRLRAAKKAKLRTVEAKVVDVDDIDAGLISIEENIQRYPLGDFEFMDATVRWKELHEQKHGKPKRGGDRRSAAAKKDGKNKTERLGFETEAAERLGVSEDTVRNVLARAGKAAPEVKEAWKSGEINASQVDEIVKLPKAQQVEVLREVVGESRDETRTIVAAKKRGIKESANDKALRRLTRLLKEATPLAERLSNVLTNAVIIIEREGVTGIGGIGTIRIGFELNVLHDMLDKLERLL